MSSEPITDAELARLGQLNDERALDEIYRRFSPIVTATARRLLRDSSDVDDVVQETFLIVFEQLGRLQEPAALRGWICRIAVSRAHRRFRQPLLVGIVDGELEEQTSTEAGPELRAELALIVRALRMPLELRTPWVLRHVAGVALEDVAAVCGWSLATVKRRLGEADAIVTRFVAGELEQPRRRRRAARGTGGHGSLIPHGDPGPET